MSWNGSISQTYWDPKKQSTAKQSNFDYINVNHISSGTINSGEISTCNLTAYNIYGYNGYIPYLSTVQTIANLVTLNPNTTLTGNNGNLFVNGVLIATPSSISSIDLWAKFPAVQDVDINWSSIINVKNLTGSNIDIKTLTGTTGAFSNLNAYVASIQFLSNKFFGGSNILASTITNSGTISSSNILAQTFNANLGDVLFLSNTTFNGRLINTSTINTNTITGKTVYLSNIFTSNLTACNGTIQNLTTSNGTFQTLTATTGTIQTLTVSNLNVSNVTAPTGYFDNIYSSNIYNSIDFQTNTATMSGYTRLNGGFETNANSYINATLGLNADINAGTNTSFLYGTEYLHSIRDIADFNCKSLSINGGWTGNDVLPPYHYNTDVNIGTPLTSPGIVTINGQNPNPVNLPNNLTTALLVRGDCVVDFGVFTAYNGAVFLPFNEEANAIDIYGTAYVTGALNVVGNISTEGTFESVGAGIVGGNLNVAGLFTATGGNFLSGGTAITGTVLVQTGDITFNSQEGGSAYTFTNYGGTILSNGLTLTGDGVARNNFQVNQNLTVLGTSILNNVTINDISANSLQIQTITSPDSNLLVKTNLNMCNFDITNVSTITTNKVVLDASGSAFIYFNDLTGNLFAEIGRLQTDSNILTIAALSNINIGANGSINIITENNLTIDAPDLTLNNSELKIKKITLQNSNQPATLVINNSLSNVLGVVGKAADNDNDLLVLSTCNIIIRADNQAFIRGDQGVVVFSEAGFGVDATAYLLRDTQAFSTIFMNSNIITDLSNVGYVDYITTCNYPTYVGGQIQHWNPDGGLYDFYYSQLYYTDYANADQDGVNGYSNHRAIAQDWSYYKCENLTLDMNSNFITNCGGLFIKTLVLDQTTLTSSGYTNAGILFNPNAGDEVFWQLVKPVYSGQSPQGSEGVFITSRTTTDGSMTAMGRLYDNTIYTPWANVTGDLMMNTNVVEFTDQTLETPYQIFFNNGSLCYNSASPIPVASEWANFFATRNVDLNNYSIVNVSNIQLSKINGSSYSPTSNWSLFNSLQNVNLGGYNISNVNNLQFANGTTSLTYNTTSNVLTYSNTTVGLQIIPTQKQIINYNFSINYDSNMATASTISSNFTLKPNKSYLYDVTIANITNSSNWTANTSVRLPASGGTTYKSLNFTQASVATDVSAGSVTAFYTAALSNFTMVFVLRNLSATNRLAYTINTDIIEL